MKELILMYVGDLAADFLYHDRKEDEDLPRGVIEAAIKNGVVSIDEILARFRLELDLAVKDIEELKR